MNRQHEGGGWGGDGGNTHASLPAAAAAAAAVWGWAAIWRLLILPAVILQLSPSSLLCCAQSFQLTGGPSRREPFCPKAGVSCCQRGMMVTGGGGGGGGARNNWWPTGWHRKHAVNAFAGGAAGLRVRLIAAYHSLISAIHAKKQKQNKKQR